MKYTFKSLDKNIVKDLERMIQNTQGQSITAYFNRVFYPRYQRAQIRRWKTKNKSEGLEWKPLDPKYKEWKSIAFKDYPFSGKKILIREGELFRSVVGDSKTYHRKLISRFGIFIATTLDYAGHVDEIRTFSTWSDKTHKQWKKDLSTHIRKNKRRGK